MSFSVRVHPAPFSPTPNRHAGIGLKMKSVGPGGSRFELVGLLDPQRKEHKRCRSPKRGRRPSAPPPQALALAVALRLAGGSREGDPTPQGAGAIPLCPRTSSIFSFDFSSFSSSMVLWPCRHHPLLQLFVMLLLRCYPPRRRWMV